MVIFRVLYLGYAPIFQSPVLLSFLIKMLPPTLNLIVLIFLSKSLLQVFKKNLISQTLLNMLFLGVLHSGVLFSLPINALRINPIFKLQYITLFKFRPLHRIFLRAFLVLVVFI